MNIKRLRPAGLLLFALAISALSNAQQQIINGTVAGSGATNLNGVTVVVKNKHIATTTNATGNFSIAASPGDILVFTFVGYLQDEEKVGTTNTLKVVMKQGTSSLDEVVVIAYGTARKKDLTGAVSTVTAKEFQTGNITSPEQLIAGKVPGVSIISNSGQPGAGSTITIRGGSSLSASNNPLIVIDGVPLDNNGVSGATNALSFINPNDVASFTVLKDASAAAIYGTRASNGVIIITTKKGKSGELKVNFSTVNSVSKVTKNVPVLSADQFRAIVNQKGTPAQIAQLGTANTNWQNEIFQQAMATDNNLSISGGIKKLPYRLSIGYSDQQGILKTDKLQRTTVGIALNPTFFNNTLKVDINLKGSMQNTRFANTGAIGAAISFDPTQPVYATNKTNRFGGYYEWLDPTSATGLMNLAGKNPLGLLNQKYDESSPQRSIGNIQFDYTIPFITGLRANLNLGYDIAKGAGTVFVSDSAAAGYLAGGVGGSNNHYKQTRQNTVAEFYLNYTKDLKAIQSRIDVLAGYSYNDYLTTNYNYASYNAQGVKYPGTDPSFAVDKPENALISFFGRANYTFKDKYLLTATFRRDGSSRFAPSNRWGSFPSIALAWNIKDEHFLADSKVLSALKIRTSYGITGQQDGIGDYDFRSFYSFSAPNAAYQFGNTYYQGYRPGGFYANRKWEQTATTNLALDYGFLNNRISGSVDFYYKKTTDLLNYIPQPAGTNFSAYIVANVGDMYNRGVEFSINTQPIKKANFSWDVNFNVTYNENNITNLTVVPHDKNYPGFPSGNIAGGIGGGFAFINAVGGSKNTFNLYQQVYNAAGAPVEGVFVDKNRDGIINQNDLYKGKSSIPKVFMGFSTSATYKHWTGGFVLRASIGNYVYNNNYSQTGTLNQITGNAVLYNASTSYLTTKFVGNAQELLSDYYLQNASFLRMDNINLGYDLGKVFTGKAKLRLNATVQNVFVITKYSGLDPEISGGIDNSLYPRPRIFSLGLNLNL